MDTFFECMGVLALIKTGSWIEEKDFLIKKKHTKLVGLRLLKLGNRSTNLNFRYLVKKALWTERDTRTTHELEISPANRFLWSKTK